MANLDNRPNSLNTLATVENIYQQNALSSNSGNITPPTRTKSRFTHNQLRALQCLFDRKPYETLEQVAERAGISRHTLNDYLKLPHFVERFQSHLSAELKASRVIVAQALIEGAVTPSKNQPAMQKIYWSLTGDLINRSEISGPNGGPIQVEDKPLPLHKLSLETRQRMLDELVAAQEIRPEHRDQVLESEEYIDYTEIVETDDVVTYPCVDFRTALQVP